MSNHELFEKWRVRDATKLTIDEKAEYDADVGESNRRYETRVRDR